MLSSAETHVQKHKLFYKFYPTLVRPRYLVFKDVIQHCADQSCSGTIMV
jgi:hypothetical protein